MRHEAIFTKFSQPVQRWWAGLKQWRLGGGEGRGEKGGRGESKGEKMLREKEKERDERKGGEGKGRGKGVREGFYNSIFAKTARGENAWMQP